MSGKEEYPVEITFTTTVRAQTREIAEQAARKKGKSMASDSANKHYTYAGVDVEEPEE